jgi:hypothetical protein
VPGCAIVHLPVDAGGYTSANMKCIHIFKRYVTHLVATHESLNNNTGDLVGAGVTGGTTVLEVTLAILGDLAGNTDGATTVGNTIAELVDATGLVTTSETLLVTLTIDGNVLNMAGLELLHGGLNDLHTTLSTHRSGRDVGVETGSVPVTLDGLGVEGDLDTKLFSDTVEEETGTGSQTNRPRGGVYRTQRSL